MTTPTLATLLDEIDARAIDALVAHADPTLVGCPGSDDVDESLWAIPRLIAAIRVLYGEQRDDSGAIANDIARILSGQERAS